MFNKHNFIGGLLQIFIFLLPTTFIFSQTIESILNEHHSCEHHMHSNDEDGGIQLRTSITKQELQNFLIELNDHIWGRVNLSAEELYAIRDGIQIGAEAGFFKGTANSAVYMRGNNTIKRYENRFGSLYTDNGVKSYNTADSYTDGKALARTMGELHAAVFDAIDNDMIAENENLVKNTVFGAHTYFPGSVDAAPSSTSYTLKINASVPKDWGRPNLYSTVDARRPTGTYLVPGTVATITVPPTLVNKGYKIRVGAHSWDLSRKNVQKRLAIVTKVYPITSTTMKVANPMGGGIYIEVPDLADEGLVNIKIKNVVRSPYFSHRSFDKTSVSKWQNVERNYPGPWTDIETDKVMMQVPSKWIRSMSHSEIMEILDEYHANTDLISKYMGKPVVRNKTIAYMQVDVIFRGSAFYPGYPMGNYPSFNSSTPKAPLTKEHSFDQAFMHEHGHATYMTKFTAETEAAVHMLYPYVVTKRQGKSLEEGLSNSLLYGKREDRTINEIFISWALRDNFINNVNMVRPESAYQHKGHADYIDYVDIFGWKAMEDFNRRLNVDFIETGRDVSRNNHQNNDRILRLSREAGKDVRPLFHLWGHSPNNQENLVSLLKSEGIDEPSAEIYDKMVAYKSVIPMTQEKYNTWFEKTGNVINNSDGFYTNLKDKYDLSRARAAVDRIDELIEYYFPNGRPNNGCQSPQATVTAYDGCSSGAFKFTFQNVSSRGMIAFSIDGGQSYPHRFADNIGSKTIENIPAGSYQVWARWGNGDCPIYLGYYTIEDLGAAPNVQVSVLDQDNEGALELDFTSNSGRVSIKFSVDGGQTYPYSYPVASKIKTIDNLPTGTYNVWTRWGNDDCPVNLGNYTISNGAKAQLFLHCYYSGKSIKLDAGKYPNIATLGLSRNALSSLKIPAGLKVTLYNRTNFRGSSITFTANDNCLINNNFNDKTESLKVEVVGITGRSASRSMVLSPEFGYHTMVDWVFRQDVTKVAKEFTILHGTSEESPLQEIAVVSASDTRGADAYSFLHNGAQPGKNYYQIMVEYEDGSVFYPMWDDISFKERPITLRIAPNPASDLLKIDVSRYMDESIDYTISDMNGEEVRSGSFDIAHSKTVQVDLPLLQNGLYIIRLKPEGNRAVAAKFMVAKDY